MTTHIHTPSDLRVFVFGSNLQGIHGAGAAKYAWRELDAAWGVNEGFGSREERSYALPTCWRPGEPLPISGLMRSIERYVQGFFTVARVRRDLRFFVSEVGCGLAGYRVDQIAPLFRGAPENCDLPPGWRVR